MASKQFRRRLLALCATVVTSAGVLIGLQTPAHADFVSSIGGDITRAEVIERAQYWVDHQPGPYSQTAYSPDPTGSRDYRRDCSGYVGMTWHLGADPSTANLGSYATVISRSDLRPGDALDDPAEHVILFHAWEPDHIHFSYYSFGSTPVKHVTGASINQAKFDSHPNADYTAIRYRNIIDGGDANGVVSGDVTGDGHADLVARKADGTLWLYANSGTNDAPYGRGTQIGTSWQQFGWYLEGDVTGDARADLVAAKPDGTLWLYTNSGSNDAPYGSGHQIGTAWQQFTHVTLADVTGDGRADLIAGKPDGTLWLYINGGSNTAPYGAGHQVGSGWSTFRFVIAGDVTGDGRADLIGTRPDGTLWLYINSGSNTAPYGTGHQIGSAWQQFDRVFTGDVTGDGRADLIASKPDGTLLLYANSGSNTAPFGSGSQIGSSWQQFV